MKNEKLNKGEPLRFKHIGNGFIMGTVAEGMPRGRKLTKRYIDQFNRAYVQVDGKLERVTPQHEYLAAD